MNFYNEAKNLHEYTRKLRRDIHAHPETAHEEIRTANIAAEQLRAFGLAVRTDVASTGVLGYLETDPEAPTVMIRADMDALNMPEVNDVPYASQNAGKMHACGHDAHTAMLITAARLLSEAKEDLKGNILFLFQPAEEGGFGAQRMFDAGALDWHKPDYSIGLHVWNQDQIGEMVIHGGPIMAGAQMFEVKITGKGGHGALPNLAIDPLLCAAQCVVNVQSIISRNLSPLQAGVISVCTFNSGTAKNVIPATAEFSGTMRAFTNDVWQVLIERFTQVIEQTAAAFGCTAEVILEEGIGATTNDDEIAVLTKEAVLEVMPFMKINETYQTMGSEDMSIWLDAVPGCFFFIGSANEKKGINAPHHHPKFDIDEDVLPMGAAALANAAKHILEIKSEELR
ncbi:MAG: M20 family metallopeptidase [Anaerolineae bacterium]|jgi:amidohydrolase|nr:M20 family metallopeptidase [Anaerolineae bacterium]